MERGCVVTPAAQTRAVHFVLRRHHVVVLAVPFDVTVEVPELRKPLRTNDALERFDARVDGLLAR